LASLAGRGCQRANRLYSELCCASVELARHGNAPSGPRRQCARVPSWRTRSQTPSDHLHLSQFGGPTAKAAEPASTRPSKAQISHIRQACRADYRAHCAGVTAGASGLACLKDNVASLSAPCRLALGDAAVGNTPQAPPAPTVSDELPVVSPREEIFIMRSACGPDFRTYCEGLRPGGGRVIGCLQANRASLSPRCQRALLALRTRR
jgi:hypothetical protein